MIDWNSCFWIHTLDPHHQIFFLQTLRVLSWEHLSSPSPDQPVLTEMMSSWRSAGTAGPVCWSLVGSSRTLSLDWRWLETDCEADSESRDSGAECWSLHQRTQTTLTSDMSPWCWSSLLPTVSCAPGTLCQTCSWWWSRGSLQSQELAESGSWCQSLLLPASWHCDRWMNTNLPVSVSYSWVDDQPQHWTLQYNPSTLQTSAEPRHGNCLALLTLHTCHSREEETSQSYQCSPT